MGFNLGTTNNTGKLNMNDFLGAEMAQNTEKEIPISQLVPWENQPFKMYSDFKMNELVESIRENGLLSRIIVSPIAGGKYRILAGHNRVEACRRAGFATVPSIVKDVDENRAKLIMADTNLCQRTELLPSERAFAYKAQQDALIALGSPRSTAAIAEKYGEARSTIQRYIACSRLVPEMLELLDNGRIGLLPAVSISGMPMESQRAIAAYLDHNPDCKITIAEANDLAWLKFVTERDVFERLGGSAESEETHADTEINPQSPNSEKKKTAANQFSKKITLQRKEVTDIIGSELTNDEISEYFYFCLQNRDMLMEWRKMYLDSQRDTGEVSADDEGVV